VPRHTENIFVLYSYKVIKRKEKERRCVRPSPRFTFKLPNGFKLNLVTTTGYGMNDRVSIFGKGKDSSLRHWVQNGSGASTASIFNVCRG